jgi:hypothetical protein
MIRSAAQRFVVALCLAGGLGIAAAQEVEPSDMVRGGLQAVQMIDQDKAGELWDGAAPVARKRVPRADFVALVAKAREPLGAPQQRTWVLVSRQAVNDTDPDASGQFVSVEYETRFANKATPVRELLSFHLDSDRIWRFSGYVLR